MAAAAAPNEFSGHLEKLVVERCRASVFFVMLTPRHGEHKSLAAHMADAKVLPKVERKKEFSNNRVGTGFVVDDEQSRLKIMTSAHLMDHVFTAKMPISPEDANTLFVVHVTCDHAELAYIAQRRRSRAYSVATVVDIDCQKDILLLEIPKADLYRSVSATGRKQVCGSSHPPLRLSLNAPEPEALDKCFMISWPSEKHLTSVRGRVTHGSRTITVMPGKNVNGYSMKLLQGDIRSEYGASGSALVNGQDDVIGMLHGGDVQFSYFVSLEDLSRFLSRNGVVRI